MFPFEQSTIFLALAGSRAHGTAHAGSDLDLRGVCVAPLAVRLSLYSTFEQYEGGLPAALAGPVLAHFADQSAGTGVPTDRIECVVFEIAKFVRLCANANPNALEILFADERDWILATPAWRRLHDERHRFLTRKVQQTFLGYALAQMRRIETHRSWLLRPPSRPPTREEFGLSSAGSAFSPDDRDRIEASLAERIQSYRIDTVEMPKAARIAVQERLDNLCRDLLAAAGAGLDDRLRALASCALQLPSDVMATLDAEKRYRAAQKHWDAYRTWQRQRNQARGDLERRHGYDTKHAMHLVRLMRMGLEVMKVGELRVRRADAAELAAIRDGALTFEALQRLAGDLQQEMSQVESTTRLPADVDPPQVDALVLAIVQQGFGP